ncbi:SDR family NAD(P)-dependent oxidoreductase [Hoeflea sp.]|uniref:SDR family NAD(P)-dependent oxidoreductase n=1 Tax=Hoeflea sp. TaxID=1940281 RepID=UPI003A8D11F5
MDLDLKDRRALITGATAGIGRAIAHSLAAEGVEIALVGRRVDQLNSVRQECLSAGALRVIAIEMDMMIEGAPEETAKQAIDQCGGIDILVNCMGASKAITLEESEEGWEASMTLNWVRHRQMTRHVLEGMQERQWGRVINVTGPNEVTVTGSNGPMGLNSAAVAKTAVHAWSKGVSDVVAKDGITVNCIGPGKIMSEQIERNYTPEGRATLAKTFIPMGRFGEPGELADLATFLASPRASYITGTVIPVDGGLKRFMF